MSEPRTVCAPEGIPVTSLTARAVAVAVAVVAVVAVAVAVVAVVVVVVVVVAAIYNNNMRRVCTEDLAGARCQNTLGVLKTRFCLQSFRFHRRRK